MKCICKKCEEIDNIIDARSESRKARKVLSKTRQNVREEAKLSIIKMTNGDNFQKLFQKNTD